MTRSSIAESFKKRPARWTALIGVSSLLGVSLFAIPRNNLDQTLAAQYELVQESPNDSMAYNDLGNLLMLAGLESEAEAVYQRAIELSPNAREPRFNRALLYQQTGRVDEARNAFTELITIDPRDAWSWYQLGVILEGEQQRGKAIDHYAKAFALDPSLTFARTNPHIIDNELSTEALLVSSKYSDSPGSLVPRHYHERARIQRELIGSDLSAGSDEEDTAIESEAQVLVGGLSGPSEASDDAPLEEIEEEPAPSEEEEEPAVTRVIGNDDLESGVSTGQVVNSRRGSSSRRATRGSSANARSSQQQESRVRNRRSANGRGDSTPSTATDGRENSGRPFQPGRASTGRLDFELLPPEPKDQLASHFRG